MAQTSIKTLFEQKDQRNISLLSSNRFGNLKIVVFLSETVVRKKENSFIHEVLLGSDGNNYFFIKQSILQLMHTENYLAIFSENSYSDRNNSDKRPLYLKVVMKRLKSQITF